MLDLLDPEEAPDSEFGRYLYSEKTIRQIAGCALNSDGVMVAQVNISRLRLLFG